MKEEGDINTELWQEYLNSKPTDNVAPPTFPITPDSSVEDPSAHVTKIPFNRSPAFLYALIAGGLTFLVIGSYALITVFSGSKSPAVAVAPTAEVSMDEPKAKDDFMDKVPDQAVKTKPVTKPSGKTPPVKKFNLRQPRASQVIWRDSRPRINNYSQTSAATPGPRIASLPKVQASPVFHPAPIKQEKPIDLEQQWRESGESLYAPESGEGPTMDPNTIASVPSEQEPKQPSNAAINEALAIYDGTSAKSTSPAEGTSPPSTPEIEVTSASTPGAKANVQSDDPQPLTSQEFEHKYPEKAAQQNLIASLAIIPAETTLKGQTMGMLSWNSQENFPVGEEIRIRLRRNFEKEGKILIPEGSIAIAQSEKGTVGQYILANVTRIETPSGQSYNIEPGMLTASTGEGFISGELKEPKHGSGFGRFASKVGRGLINFGVASVVPNGDQFLDRVTQNVASQGLNSINAALDDQRVSTRQQIPSFYVIKPKTNIELIANGDIQLQ